MTTSPAGSVRGIAPLARPGDPTAEARWQGGPTGTAAAFDVLTEKRLAAAIDRGHSAGSTLRGDSVMGMVRVFRGRGSVATWAGAAPASRAALPRR